LIHRSVSVESDENYAARETHVPVPVQPNVEGCGTVQLADSQTLFTSVNVALPATSKLIRNQIADD